MAVLLIYLSYPQEISGNINTSPFPFCLPSREERAAISIPSPTTSTPAPVPHRQPSPPQLPPSIPISRHPHSEFIAPAAHLLIPVCRIRYIM
ncbi:MAG: hypothetical protein MJE68_33210 [Proteobacteria bacterium]|nr:hypothetical protein [Pseudomonadota bacterium]